MGHLLRVCRFYQSDPLHNKSSTSIKSPAEAGELKEKGNN